MSVYKIKYELRNGEETHYRYYRALNKETAKEMFKETVESGSLTGHKPNIVEIRKETPKKQ
ncbi:MAG: hypothetical protein CL885_03145 [Dehalococcoidia bacterium]|nr:hypothetical protein [Dehalococcoidia bacterium]|tara:strand:+ start:1020 stop:1202 length:183 start_codon:yes stop_codon:yes gene_type:complete